MAKKIVYHSIKKAEDLITSREQTRAGFVAMALEKNYLAIPYVEEAKALKLLSKKVKKPIELLDEENLRIGLLSASGLSEKSLTYLTEKDKILAIQELITKFLEPAGNKFVDELVYRYLLVKGDALGGKARNLAGMLGERTFLRTLLSVFHIAGVSYKWRDKLTQQWIDKRKNTINIENKINAIHWTINQESKLLLMNITVPIVRKNIDISIINGGISDIKKGKESIIYRADKYIALGELKAGIDPAGADEHWKTANSALVRIRNGFNKLGYNPQTFFIGAAIEKAMANELFDDLQKGKLDNVANLTDDQQLTDLCNWIVQL